MAWTYESLVDALAPLDALRERYKAIERPAPRSAAERDGRRRIGRYPVQLAGMALASALDHIEGWSSIVHSRRLPTYAPYTLLRAAMEGAVLARWLVDPAESQDVRIRRGIGAQRADYDERRKVETVGDRDRVVVNADDLPGKSAKRRIADLDRAAKDASLAPIDLLGPTELCRRYGGLPDEPDGIGEGRYRILSGAAHSKQWTAWLLAVAEPDDPPNPDRPGRAAMTIHYEATAGTTERVIGLVDLAVAEFEAYVGRPAGR